MKRQPNSKEAQPEGLGLFNFALSKMRRGNDGVYISRSQQLPEPCLRTVRPYHGKAKGFRHDELPGNL
jgi:hypothetical protein